MIAVCPGMEFADGFFVAFLGFGILAVGMAIAYWHGKDVGYRQ